MTETNPSLNTYQHSRMELISGFHNHQKLIEGKGKVSWLFRNLRVSQLTNHNIDGRNIKLFIMLE